MRIQMEEDEVDDSAIEKQFIYEVQQFTDDIDEDEPTEIYPVKIYKQRIGLFETLELAEAYVQSILAKDGSHEHYDITRFLLNTSLRAYESRIYGADGALIGQHDIGDDRTVPFDGRTESELRHKDGDYVQFEGHSPKGRACRCGIIGAPPLSPDGIAALKLNGKVDMGDDVYMVLCGVDEFDHQHLPDCLLFEPAFVITAEKEAYLHHRLKQYQAMRSA